MAVERDRRRSGDRNWVVGLLLVALLYFARDVFIPIAMAALLAFLLAPLASRLEGWGMRRVLAVALVIATAFSAVAAIGWVVMGQVYSLAVELPQYQPNVTSKIASLHLHSAGKLTSTMQMLSEVSREISGSDEPVASGALTPGPLPRPLPRRSRRETAAEMEAQQAAAAATAAPPQKKAEPVAVRVEEPETSMLTVAGRSIRPLVQPLTTALIVVVFVVFMLLGRDDLRDRAIRLAGSSRMHVTTVAMSDASARVSRYLLMQFVVNVSYGTVVGVALWRIGVPHPLLWAVMTALLRFIPYAGILLAAAGPLLMAAAISPHWGPVLWTMGLFGVLELTAANFLEPMLYGSSTGVSAFAIMIAAIFWTWMWGVAGLLLSTPMTVCLIVIGRHVPKLEFLGVLFGEQTALEPQQRFYQRVLALDLPDATRVLEGLLKSSPRQEVYDTVVVPALTLVEESRHADEIDGVRAEQVLQAMEELVEESWSRTRGPALEAGRPKQQLMCVPARDMADEIACRLLLQVMSERYRVQVLSSELLTADVLEAVRAGEPDVVCVVGVPPQTMRHVRLRCHQVRVGFPEMVVAACVLSADCDLSAIRGRIPMEDAQHVVCSIEHAREYLTAVGDPAGALAERASLAGEAPAAAPVEELQRVDLLDGADGDVFARIVTSLAKAFDAPIALLSAKDGGEAFWRAQCGLAVDADGGATEARDQAICALPMHEGRSMVVPDVEEDARFRGDAFLLANGIRFYAAAPLRSQDGSKIGCLCVMDTRPRQPTEQQREMLQSLADQVMNAIELQMTAELVSVGGRGAAEGAPNAEAQAGVPRV